MFQEMRIRLPVYDRAIAALFEDLHERGLAERVLLGSPARVSPVLRNSAPGQDKFLDDVIAVFEFESAVAVVKSQRRQSERYFHIFGEEGSLLIDSPDRPQVRMTLGAKHDKFAAGVHTIPMAAAERYVPDLDDLATAIRDHRGVEHFTPEHDLAVHRALLAACGSKP